MGPRRKQSAPPVFHRVGHNKSTGRQGIIWALSQRGSANSMQEIPDAYCKFQSHLLDLTQGMCTRFQRCQMMPKVIFGLFAASDPHYLRSLSQNQYVSVQCLGYGAKWFGPVIQLSQNLKMTSGVILWKADLTLMHR